MHLHLMTHMHTIVKPCIHKYNSHNSYTQILGNETRVHHTSDCFKNWGKHLHLFGVNESSICCDILCTHECIAGCIPLHWKWGLLQPAVIHRKLSFGCGPYTSYFLDHKGSMQMMRRYGVVNTKLEWPVCNLSPSSVMEIRRVASLQPRS